MSPTELDLEPRLIETLRAKAAQLPDLTERFDAGAVDDVVDLGGGDGRGGPGARPWLVAAAAVLFVIIAVAGLVIAFDGGDAGEPTSPPPAEPAAGLTIDALPDLRFQLSEFTTAAGLNEISFTSFGGTHGLRFEDPNLADFELYAMDPDVPSRGEVTLEAGHDYRIYCPIPGHREAGMKAVIHVRAPGERPTKGQMPVPTPLRPNGTPDLSQMPDFIAAIAGPDGAIGYVPREYFFGARSSDAREPVYAEDLETLIGHMYVGRGFVALGQDPESVPLITPTTTIGATTTTLSP